MVFHMYSLLKSSLWKRGSFHLEPFCGGFFPSAQLPGHMVHQLLDKGHLGIQGRIDGEKKTQVLKEKSLEDWWFVSSFCKEFGRTKWGIVFCLGWAAWGSLKMESRKASTWGFQRSLVMPPRSWDYLLMMPKKSGKSNDRNLGTWETKWFWGLKTILLENFSHWVIPDYANKHGKKHPPKVSWILTSVAEAPCFFYSKSPFLPIHPLLALKHSNLVVHESRSHPVDERQIGRGSMGMAYVYNMNKPWFWR